MPNRVGTLNTFAGSAPPWSLPNLDANFTSISTALNDSSLGYSNYIGVDTGGANNYVVSCTFGVPTAYNVGMTLTFKPAVTNTGASTINVNSLGTIPIQHGDGTACVGGEIQAGKNISLIYNGTAFQIQGPPFGYGTTLYYDYDDFVAYPGGPTATPGTPGGSKLFALVAGTSASIIQPGFIAGHPGTVTIQCGTSPGQTVRAHLNASIYLDSLSYTIRALVFTPVVIDANQSFFGFLANPTIVIGSSQQAIGFLATSSSSFWQMCTANGSTQTNSPTTQTVSANTWYDLMIVANAVGATFFVNGTQVGTQSTSYPASSAAMLPGFLMGAVTGVNRGFTLDLFEILISQIPVLTGSTNPRFLHGYV